MCAVCGCLTTSQPAPEEGTYKCLECDKSGGSSQVKVKKGDKMPNCSACGEQKGHWVKV
jgi:transcription elongation factor Elf1